MLAFVLTRTLVTLNGPTKDINIKFSIASSCCEKGKVHKKIETWSEDVKVRAVGIGRGCTRASPIF